MPVGACQRGRTALITTLLEPFVHLTAKRIAQLSQSEGSVGYFEFLVTFPILEVSHFLNRKGHKTMKRASSMTAVLLGAFLMTGCVPTAFEGQQIPRTEWTTGPDGKKIPVTLGVSRTQPSEVEIVRSTVQNHLDAVLSPVDEPATAVEEDLIANSLISSVDNRHLRAKVPLSAVTIRGNRATVDGTKILWESRSEGKDSWERPAADTLLLVSFKYHLVNVSGSWEIDMERQEQELRDHRSNTKVSD